MQLPDELKEKLPPGLEKDLQAEFKVVIKKYATDIKWRRLLTLISEFTPEERARALDLLENDTYLTEPSKRFFIKLLEGDLADKLLDCIQIYEQNPW